MLKLSGHAAIYYSFYSVRSLISKGSALRSKYLMLQKSNPDHPRLCSRKWRWKLLPITFLTCDILHKPGQSISKFLKSDLWHFRYSFQHMLFLTVEIYWPGCQKTSQEWWVQTQRWHTTLMGRNFHPKVAAFLSSISTLVTSWVSHELKLWVQ